MIYYYSGCGNSSWVARQIAEGLSEKLTFIPEAGSACELQPGESLGFVFPVYSWAPPELVDKFVRSLTFTLKPEYVYLVCTCGDEVGRTPELFAQALRSVGLGLDAVYSVQMPETYINLPGFKLDTPEGAVLKQNAARERLASIIPDLRAQKRGVVDVVVGGMPAFKSGFVKWLFYKLLITDKRFHVSSACVGCGICANNCPVKNITIEEGRPVWHHSCVGCMSCYHRCPQNAINWGKYTRGKGQYYCNIKD